MTDTSAPMTKSRLLLLRRVCATISLAGTVAILLLMLFGFIRLGSRPLTVFSGVNLLFYVFDFGTRPFITIVINVGFALAYYILCIKTLVSITGLIRIMPRWLRSKLDSAPTRSAAYECVGTFAKTFTVLCIEMTSARLLLGTSIPTASVAVLVVLALLVLASGALFFQVANRNLVEGMFVTACRLCVLLGALLFAFLVCNSSIADLWSSVGRFFSYLETGDPETGFIFDVLINTVAVPLLQFISVAALTKMAYQTLVQSYEIRDTAAGFLKYSVITLIIIVVANGILCQSRNPSDYLDMLLRRSLFALIPLFVYLSSKNIFILSKSAPYIEDEPAEGSNVGGADRQTANAEKEAVEESCEGTEEVPEHAPAAPSKRTKRYLCPSCKTSVTTDDTHCPGCLQEFDWSFLTDTD